MKVQRIIVPIRDLSAGSRAAARKALDLARATGATLELFHAVDTDIDRFIAVGSTLAAELQQRTEMRAMAHLERIARVLRRAGLPVLCAVESGYPAYEAIIRRASTTKADLIVVDTHRRHRAAGLLGFTDWQLLRKSPVPVLLTKGLRRYRHGTVLAAVDPQLAFEKTAALDERILDAATTIAAMLKGELHVTHAYAALAGGARFDYIDPLLTEDLLNLVSRDARNAFESLLQARAIPAAHRHLVCEHPGEAIPSLARKLEADIVVMGVVARSPLRRWLIGSTAERVLDDVECDVLVVSPDPDVAQLGTSEANERSTPWNTAGALAIR